MLQNLVGYLPRLASALLVVVFGFFAAQSIRTIAQSGLQNMGVEFHETLSWRDLPIIGSYHLYRGGWAGWLSESNRWLQHLQIW